MKKKIILLIFIAFATVSYSQSVVYNPLVKKNLDKIGVTSTHLDSTTAVTDMKTDNTADKVLGYENGLLIELELYDIDRASYGGYYITGNADSLWIEKPKGTWLKKIYP